MDDKYFLKLAVEQAKISVSAGGFPAGTVIVKDKKVISEGISIGNKLHDPTEHSDMSAIKKACQQLETTNLSGATLYAALEGCNMCFYASNWAGISKIVYACRRTPEMVKKFYYEGQIDIHTLNESNSRKIELVYISDFEVECLNLIKEWEDKINSSN